jgi:L-lactate dehydrogenase complex protein LldE
MLRVFYLDLFADDAVLLPQAKQLAAKTYEFSEFLTDVLGVEETGASYPAKATYHPSCHLLRELGAREGPERLLRNVDGLELTALPQAETCCGFGGTFSVKYPHISEGMMADKIANVLATDATTLVSCDMGCLMHIGGGLSRQGHKVEVRHIAEVLDGAAPDGGSSRG